MLRETYMPPCIDPAFLLVQEDSYDSSGAYREKGISILETAYGGKIDPISGENFDETGRDWDIDHYFPKSKAVAEPHKSHFERLWNMTFGHLPEHMRPAPDPNSAINLRFCERSENIHKSTKIPSDRELITFWQMNYLNIMSNEIELMAKLALDKFEPAHYGLMDDQAKSHFGYHEEQAYHIHSVYQTLALVISLAEKTGKPHQAITGFRLADHMSHVRANPLFPEGEALREGKVKTANVTLFNDKGRAQQFDGSIITVDDDLKRWFKRYESFAQEAIPYHLSKALEDIRTKMAHSPTLRQKLEDYEAAEEKGPHKRAS
jgi:hypothetical protein